MLLTVKIGFALYGSTHWKRWPCWGVQICWLWYTDYFIICLSLTWSFLKSLAGTVVLLTSYGTSKLLSTCQRHCLWWHVCSYLDTSFNDNCECHLGFSICRAWADWVVGRQVRDNKSSYTGSMLYSYWVGEFKLINIFLCLLRAHWLTLHFSLKKTQLVPL